MGREEGVEWGKVGRFEREGDIQREREEGG